MTEVPAVEAPRRVADLQRAVATLARSQGSTATRLQSLIANVTLAQMLPDSAVKGGTGLKLRYGDAPTRATPDLDTAFRGDLDEFYYELEANLADGWGDFGGKVKRGERRAPDTFPAAYVMQPFVVSLEYRGKGFARVEVEVGFDELESTTRDEVESEISVEILQIFADLGLPTPNPVRVLPLHHQIAQKLHACTEPGSMRAHDIVDLQIMAPHTDPAEVTETATRLFKFRQQHEWSDAVVTPIGEWESLYLTAADGLGVIQDFDAAIVWANAYIDSLRAPVAAAS